MKRRITKESLKKATEHLLYEIEMFYQTLDLLAQPRNQIEVNVLLDSFTLHLRNLFYFFYPIQKSRKNQQIKFKHNDDMFAFDYIDKPGNFRCNKTKKKALKFILRKVDKQVAHLTYTRNRYNLKTKSWPFIDIGKKMTKTLISFYDSLPDAYKRWDNIKKLKKIIDYNSQYFYQIKES